MKILLVNPWAVNNDEFYTSGLTYALSQRVELDLATNWYYKGEKPSGHLFRVFFKKSEYSKGKLRKAVRGLEYMKAYSRILKMAQNGKYDYIHIQWLLMYKLDIKFLKKLNMQGNKIVLTAHNAIPHVDSQKYIDNLRIIYKLVHTIIVHGEAIKAELLSVFPEFEAKIIIQPHGAILKKKELDESVAIDESIKDRLQGKETYIMFGNQFFNKGTDRLLKIWKEDYLADSTKLLIVAGRRINDYPELDNVLENIKPDDNMLYLEGYIKDEWLDYLIINSEAVLLPYRHASMSGVVFTAAEYSKTVLTTQCGAICEYMENGKDSIIVENNDEDFRNGLYKLMMLSSEERKEYGQRLYTNINEKYSWTKIAELLTEKVYLLFENGG